MRCMFIVIFIDKLMDSQTTQSWLSLDKKTNCVVFVIVAVVVAVAAITGAMS